MLFKNKNIFSKFFMLKVCVVCNKKILGEHTGWFSISCQVICKSLYRFVFAHAGS